MSSSIWQTGRYHFLSIKSLIIIVLIAFLYICLSAFLLNAPLVLATVSNTYPLMYKIAILTTLVQGLWTGLSFFDFLFLLITSILVGVNLLLVIKTLYLLEHSGKVRMSIGGATIISFITTGCASCGLSLLSVFGLSASLSFLPFHGSELHVLAITLLLISCVYMLQQLYKADVCAVSKKSIN